MHPEAGKAVGEYVLSIHPYGPYLPIAYEYLPRGYPDLGTGPCRDGAL